MTDDYQEAWNSQPRPRLLIDADLLLNEVQRNQRNFSQSIFWRDVREIGVGLVMVPVWIYLGIRLALPWAWYLTVPVLLWIVCFLWVDRLRQRKHTSESNPTLRRYLENSLREVKHQIWLLRNVLWWYILPPAVSAQLFVFQVAWLTRSEGWLTLLVIASVIAIEALFLAGVYWVNLKAVRTVLEPRSQELEALLANLGDANWPDEPEPSGTP